MAQDLPTLLTEKEAAALMKIKPQTLRRMRSEGNGPSYVKGEGIRGRVLYPLQLVQEYLDEHLVETTEAN